MQTWPSPTHASYKVCDSMRKMAFVQRKSPVVFYKRHSTNSQSSPTSRIFQDFTANTTLLGIQHILRNKSAIWLVAYLICVAMSIVQSWSVTVTFFQQKTTHSITFVSKARIPFPSVTVCTNTLLRKDFNFSRIPGFTVMKNDVDHCEEDKMKRRKVHKAMNDNTAAVRKFCRSLSDEERFSLGLNLSKVVTECKFGTVHCDVRNATDFYVYSSPWYGNCFTFNPSFNDTAAKSIVQDARFKLKLRFPSEGFRSVSSFHPRVGILIHPPGTAPMMSDPEVSDLSPGDKLDIVINLEEMLSIKKQTARIPSCVDSEDETYRRRSFFYKDKSPYKYSQEACFKSCKQNIYAGCGLLMSSIPVQSKEYERNKSFDITTKGCELENFNMEECNCPIPCKKIAYLIFRDLGEIYSCKNGKINKNKGNDEYENEAQVSVRFRSGVYERIEEQLAYGLSEYLGILGGNMSLWIGLCIISLLELIELAIKVIAAAIRPLPK